LTVMPRLKKTYRFETTFGIYVVDEIVGEGGAGRVFGGVDSENDRIALKVLTDERASADKRRRFKNEIAFLSHNNHANIVPVIDHGVTRGQEINGPFYVMPRYDGSLRDVMCGSLPPKRAMSLFSQIIDGVEAAHLQKVVHRDLKPENILYARGAERMAIADFGIAEFSQELVATLVETGPSQRLANFQYAAPEQRTPGQNVSYQADIYALGLILNEMFTGVVPHGTQYRSIEDIDEEFAYLDTLVAKMLAQSPASRPSSIGELKWFIQRYQAEAVSLQRISNIDGSVVNIREIDDPLANDPPCLAGVSWDRGQLTLTLDRPITGQWVEAFYNMGNVSSLTGVQPQSFVFNGRDANVSAAEHEVQFVIDLFKTWLPEASQALRTRLEVEAQQQENQRREQLRRQRAEEESRLRVMRNIRI
jgi:serine/threonine protein kinase